MGDAGLRFCLKTAGSTMPSRFQGRLSPLAREALAEVMATFILVVSTHYNRLLAVPQDGHASEENRAK